jgi:hypothetical protein
MVIGMWIAVDTVISPATVILHHLFNMNTDIALEKGGHCYEYEAKGTRPHQY